MAHELYWYCCYGSNLSKDRFLCYIKGGTPRYGKTRGRGCDDKNFLDQSIQYKMSYPLYFGLPKGRKATSNWGTGGVAFLDRYEKSGTTTLCRLWKVTSEQFGQIWDQEGTGWYNELIKLDTVDGLPVFTFTRREPGLNFKVPKNERPPDITILKPSETYLKTIIWGVIETYPDMEKRDVLEYMMPIHGVEGEYPYEELAELYRAVDKDMNESQY